MIKNIIFGSIILIILIFSLRGVPGNVTVSNINSAYWNSPGPFELSVERGRFALTFSLAENNSFYFSLPAARFSIPDLGFKNGHYVSLFAPAVSYIVMPGYYLGRSFGLSQVGAFAVISMFAFFNFLLIRAIAVRLGAHPTAALIGGLAFLFATPAFTYATTMYQHHISTFLILASIYILLRWKNIWSLLVVWFLCGMSIPVDYPNMILMFPIGLFALTRFINFQLTSTRFKLDVKFRGFLTFASVILPLAFFMWFNFKSYGSPLQFSGTVPGVRDIDASGKPAAPRNFSYQDVSNYIDPNLQKKSAVAFFQTRNILNGLYIHILSPDRGMLYFTPIVLIGLLGAYFVFKEDHPLAPILLGVVAADLTLYSLWGDPWGGWAFGSRYLIPGYSIMGIFLAILISHWQKKTLLLVVVFITLAYSIQVNTLGALSSISNPPQVEILALEKVSGHQERYSYDRNLQFVMSGGSKSFLFNLLIHRYLNSFQYYSIVVGAIGLLSLLLFTDLHIYGRS